MSKTIWFINDYAGSKYHGMTFRHYYLAKEMVKQGHTVYIITASYSHLLKKYPEMDAKKYMFEEIDGIHYVWQDVPSYTDSRDKKRILKWFVFFKRLLMLPIDKMKTPDYIVVSASAPFFILPGYYLAKKLNAKLAFEVRDIWPLTLIELGGYSKYHPFIIFMQWCENFAYKKSDLTISLLEKSFSHMELHGLKKDKFTVIPNGVSLDEMKYIDPLDQKTIDKIPENKFIIGYTGTFGVANALKFLLQAAKILINHQDIHFLLVGDGKEKFSLKELVKNENLKNVTFIDSIPKSQVQSMLQIFDVCYIGLKDEPLFRFGVSPNKLFDYMYAAKPIIYAINSGNKPVENAQCGISIEAENSKDIADGILKIYDMPVKEREVYGENAKKYVLKNHSYEELAKNYIETLDEIKMIKEKINDKK